MSFSPVKILSAHIFLLPILWATWPLQVTAEITPAADAPQPLSPEMSLQHFQLPDGFEIQIVASEPLLADPSAVLFDHLGRMFVCELHGYNLEGHLDVVELNKTGELDRQVRRVFVEGELLEKAKRQRTGTVKLLIDSDNDGRMDRAHVWADDLPPCYGMVAYRDGVIVVCGPDIVFLADRDQDGQAEIRQVLFTGFEVDVMERAINSPHWGLDNWIYVAAGGKAAEVTGPRLEGTVSLGRTDFRFRPDGTQIEPVTGVNSTFGHALSDFGDRFLISTSTPAMYATPIPYRYVIRNPYVPGPEENARAADYRRVYPTSQPHPWRLARGQDTEWVKFYGEREATPNGFFTSGCGPLIYRAGLLPEQYHGNYFCCDPSQNLVHRCRLLRDGAGFRAERAPTEQQAEFLTSSDPWFRPMNLSVGPDGAIYIVDLYREIIEDYSAIPRFLQQQYNLMAGADRGRIWRLAPKRMPQAKRGKLANLASDELTAYLEHDNAWWREHAQRMLIESHDLEAVAGLAKLVRTGRTPQARLHALYTLAELGQLKSNDVRQALGDSSDGVRVHALRLAERLFSDDDALAAAVISRAGDDDPRVRLQVALTLGELDESGATDTLATLAAHHGQERWMAEAIVSSAADSSHALIAKLLDKHKQSAGAPALLKPLASSVGARHDEAAITQLLQLIASLTESADLLWQGELLEGMADGLARGTQPRVESPVAAQAVHQILATSSPKLRLLALQVARLLRVDVSPVMQGVWDAAASQIFNEEGSLVDRHLALGLLAESPWPIRQKLAKLLDPRQPIELQLAAARALSASDDAAVSGALLSGWRSLSPQVQEVIIDALFARSDRLPALLDAIENGVVTPSDLNSLRRAQLLDSADAPIRQRAGALIASSTTAARSAVIEKYQEVYDLAGNADQGRLVFDQQCAKCHQLEQRGFAVGPNLTGSKGRPDAALLSDILDPSGTVAPEYRVYAIATEQGRTLTGVLANETATSVTLRREKGEEDIVLRKDIQEMTLSSTSLMPDGMEKVLTPHDMANLLAYLRAALGPELPAGVSAIDDLRIHANRADVVPIDWTRFDRAGDDNRRLAESTSLLLNCARYNLAWIDRTFELDQQGQAYVLKGFEEHGVRPACSVVYGLGVVLRAGIYDAEIVGMSQEEAKQRTIQLIRGILRAHRSNRGQGAAWGVKYPPPASHEYWQTALWSALSGMGGWLMWDELDTATQEMLVAMLEQETTRFFHPDYRVPYWNGEGGDTKAEENSWNSMPLALLAAMMPEHPQVERWKRRCSELMVSSYSTRDDWKTNRAMIDGQPVNKWLAGYNAEPGGVVVNHGFIHPDYMAAISMNFWGLTSQSLAGKPAPQAWDFNAPLIYNTLVSKQWDSPPFEQPGGTIYLPGKANVYYPRGNDWSYHDLTIFYLMDVFADLYSWHDTAAAWIDIRARAMLDMQARHDDRMMFADGEYDSYPGCEQWAFWCLTDAFLPLWLDAHGALGEQANWLARKVKS